MAWSEAARAAALEVRRRNAMVTVYHGTTTKAAKQIMKEGFRPTASRRRYRVRIGAYAGSPTTATYVSQSKGWAKVFAERYSKRDGGAVITMKVPAKRLKGEGGGFFFIRGRLSPQRIVKVKLRPNKTGWR